jgi:hypothetical protein
MLVDGLSFGDVVAVRPGESWPVVDRVVAHAGHSTYRVFADAEAFERRWETLRVLGCGCERDLPHGLVGINVPPAANIRAVYAALKAGEAI